MATTVGKASGSIQVFRSLPPIPSADPQDVGIQQFDIRARLVEYNPSTAVWGRSRILEASTLTFVEVANGTSTLSLTMSSFVEQISNWAVVDVEAWDGHDWHFTNHRFVMSRLEDDPVDILKMRTWSGIEFVDYQLNFLYSRAPHVWEGDKDVAATKDKPQKTMKAASPGTIMEYMMAAGRRRDWGTRMRWTFDDIRTSKGDKWVNKEVERNIAAGTPQIQVLEGLVSDGLVEYSAHYPTPDPDDALIDNRLGVARLVLKNPGTGNDWTYSQSATSAARVINLSTAPLKTAPHRASVEGRVTRVTVQGEEDTQATAQIDSFDYQVFGQMEGWVQAAGVKSDKTAAKIAQRTLDNTKKSVQERSFTYDAALLAAEAMFPLISFKVNDWILVPVNSAQTNKETARDRVAQISIDKQIDGIEVTITTGNRILTGTAALSKSIKATSGGAYTGSGSSSGMPTPPAAAPKKPNVPTVLSATSTAFWDSNGNPNAEITWTWAPVYTAVGGGAIVVENYEIFMRRLGAEFVQVGFSGTNTFTLRNLEAGVALEYQIRAYSHNYGNNPQYSDFSPIAPVATAMPDLDLPGPDLADLYTDGLGMIFAVWGGLLDTEPPRPGFAYVIAEVRKEGEATWFQRGTTLSASGTIMINLNSEWGTYHVRLRAFDNRGNAGTASDPQTITIADPHINPPTPNAPTSLSSTPGADWGPSGFLPNAWFDLSWIAPTVDTDGNAISIVGYDVFGLKSTETIERYITTSATNGVRVPVGNGETWTFRVRATSIYGGVSAFSATVTDTADVVLPGAPVPEPPVLSQYMGLLTVNWSGEGLVPQVKYVYASISTTLGGTYIRSGMPLVGEGQVVVPNLAPDTYYAKMTMVDQNGNISTSVASDPIVLLPPTGVTIQTSELAHTGIKLTNASLTAYDVSGNPTFTLVADTGEVFIAAYDAVFDLGATGTAASTGAAVNGLAISSENSDFNTFVHPSGVQIRRNQTALSWWEGDATDLDLINFFSPRAVIGQRLRVGDYEFLNESKTTGSRIVVRYKGA